ncbi:MAG: zinc-ribbon domain-containing protein [Chloroflexi bacterium]|nr:zinc-ribbon domain-containing protein [Chloroflexota bacterium]
MVTCSKCGTQNRDETKYCKNCGTRLAEGSVIPCSKCGASNLTSSLFCNRCGERLVPDSAGAYNKATRAKVVGKTVSGGDSERGRTTAVATKVASTPESTKSQTPFAPDKAHDTTTPTEKVPDWLTRFYETPPSQTRLIPTHDLLRMANALGIDVDYSTLRFWQKRGLVPKPTRGRVSTGRGTRGYYDPSLIDRLSFIRDIQKIYAMNLEVVREELDQIDRKIAAAGRNGATDPYKDRLSELQAQRDLESKRTLVTVLSKVLGLDVNEIASVTVQKKNGQTIRFLPDKSLQETETH